MLRCSSAREGEDEVEGGGGGMLLDVEPGNKQTNKHRINKQRTNTQKEKEKHTNKSNEMNNQ